MRPTWLLSGCITMLLTLHADAPGVAADEVKEAGPHGGIARESDEALRQILREAVGAVTSPVKADEKEDELGLHSFERTQLEKPTAEALLAIGTAQAKVGDREAARKTWQDANDRISSLSSFDSHEVKPTLLMRLADAQVEAGERDEASATIRQALQAVRLINSRPDLPLPVLFKEDPQKSQCAVLRQVAAAQARVGDDRAARKSFEQALEAAGAIKDENARVDALIEIARAGDREAGREAWTRATDLALSLKEGFRKSKAIEAVLRGLIESGSEKDALGLVADRLAGDVQTYGTWVVAAALLDRERAIPAEVVGPLAALAERIRFDRPSKHMKVLIEVAMVHARTSDDDGAYRTIDAFPPQNGVQRTEMILAKCRVMKEIANGQIRAGKRDQARGTLQAALEAIAPFQDSNGGLASQADEFLPLMAKAGASAAAVRLAGEIRDARRRADVLVEIASAQAESGEREAALKTLESARSAIDGIANATLWSGIGSAARALSSRIKADLTYELGLELGIKHQSMKNLAIGLAKAGDVTRALEIADALAAEENRMGRHRSFEALEAIASSQTRAGDFAGAVKTADHVPDASAPYLSDRKIAILKQIAEAQARSGDAKGVLAWGTIRTSPGAKLAVLEAMAEGIVARKGPAKGKDAAAANTP